MNNNMVTTQNVETMSSIDFMNNYINPARVAAGEAVLENRKLNIKIEDECDDLVLAEFYSVTSQGAKRRVKCYKLTYDQMMLVGMRESKAVRKSVLAN